MRLGCSFLWCTISYAHFVPVVYMESKIIEMSWINGTSHDPCVTLSSVIDGRLGYVIVESGRITYAETWRGTSTTNISYQRPAQYRSLKESEKAMVKKENIEEK